jgi:multidrug efflux pump subunit AcrA (membrane-fusion protein)
MVGRKVITIAAASAVFLAWGALSAHSTTQDPVTARATVSSGTLRLERCQTYWAKEVIISSKIPGKIDRRLVEDGQQVNEGDVLAMLDARDAEIELAIQEILGSSDLDEKSQREKLDEYRARLDAASKLIGRRAISEEEWRLALVNVNVNQFMTLKEVEKRTVEHMKADRARVFLDDHVITSPIRGVIKKCFKREKESVSNTDLQLFHIVARDKVWVEGFAPVREMYRVKVGQDVEVKLAISELERGLSDPGRPSFSPGLTTSKSTSEAERPSEPRAELPQEKIIFPGKIMFIDPDANFSAGKFRVRAEVDNKLDPDGEPILRAGLNTTMTIQLNSK